MEKIIVSKDKCPLDVLAEMGEQTKYSWIYLHDSAVKKLKKTATKSLKVRDAYELQWDETDQYPKTILTIKKHDVRGWWIVNRIFASVILHSSLFLKILIRLFA